MIILPMPQAVPAIIDFEQYGAESEVFIAPSRAIYVHTVFHNSHVVGIFRSSIGKVVGAVKGGLSKQKQVWQHPKAE
jgi:hypothetical protein